MSYILDALRKADAERQRGAVPGLHDQAGAAGGAAASGAGPGRGRRMPLIIGLPVAAALVGVLWVYRGLWPGFAVPPAQERGPQATSAPTLASAQAVQRSASEAAVSVAQAPVTGVDTPATATAPLPLPTPLPAPAPAPAPAGLAAPSVVPLPTPQPSTPPAPKPAPPGTAAVTPPPAAPAPQTLPRLADLPEAQRRELPPLVVSGAVQSPDPASRMLILDGQVLREGDAVAAGLVLERIGLRAAVLSLRGLRFELPL